MDECIGNTCCWDECEIIPSEADSVVNACPPEAAHEPVDPSTVATEHTSGWELCMGGCGSWLKAGRWGVCKACHRAGHAGREYPCDEGFVPCRGCGVQVKEIRSICKRYNAEERSA